MSSISTTTSTGFQETDELVNACRGEQGRQTNDFLNISNDSLQRRPFSSLSHKNLLEEAEFLYDAHQQVLEKNRAKDQHIKELEDKIKELETENEALQSSIQGKVEDAGEGGITYREQELCLNHMIKDENMEEIMKENKILVEKNLGLDQELIKLRKDVAEIVSTRRDHEAALRRLSMQDEDLKTTKFDRDVAYKEKQECESQLQRLVIENEELKSKITGLANELQIANVRVEQAEQKVTSLEIINNDLEQRCRAAVSEKQRLSQQLRTLDVNGGDGEPDEEMQPPLKKTRAEEQSPCRFQTSPSQVPFCRNCRTLFFPGMEPGRIPCRFHKLQPLPYDVWKSSCDSSLAANPKYRHKMFWSCCDKYSKVRPIGCMTVPNHNLEEPLFGHVA